VITNERQLAIARANIERFSASLAAIEQGLGDDGRNTLMQEMQRDAIAVELEQLRGEVEEYERLRSGDVAEFDLRSLADLPALLIKARIAAGLTQKELAERAGIKEQQVQRYEANGYDGASFTRIAEVADALGLKIGRRIELLRTGSLDGVLKSLTLLGVTESFIRRRLVPQLGESRGAAALLLDRVRAIFGWEPRALEAGTPLSEIAGAGGALARFKMPRSREERASTAYTAYAFHLASICASASTARKRKPVPTGWKEFRSALLASYPAVDLASTLSFAWDLGVIVLPLRDPGGFHGACWRIGGVNVVVLKQLTTYPARWLFDLIHELFHCGQDPDSSEFALIEDSELSEARRTSTEERHAMWFAGQVGLDGRAEELAKLAIARANNGYLPRLKDATIAVAAEQGISVGYLANYLAYRLSLQSENWWGTAANLQERDHDPYTLARDLFFERFDFSNVSKDGAELLALALDDEVDDG
jgi:transcriptional regulator with XRE-family HTH domain